VVSFLNFYEFLCGLVLFWSMSSIKRELFEQQCLEEKYRTLLNLITDSLDPSSGRVNQEQAQETVNFDTTTTSGASKLVS